MKKHIYQRLLSICLTSALLAGVVEQSTSLTVFAAETAYEEVFLSDDNPDSSLLSTEITQEELTTEMTLEVPSTEISLSTETNAEEESSTQQEETEQNTQTDSDSQPSNGSESGNPSTETESNPDENKGEQSTEIPAEPLSYNSVPQNPFATLVRYNRIHIEWDLATDATGYEIYHSTDGMNYEKLASVSDSSYLDKSLKTGHTYYYKVRAFLTKDNQTAYSDYSTVVSATAMPTAPDLEASPKSSNSIRLDWSVEKGSKGYIIYRAKGSGKFKKIATISGAKSDSYIDKNLSFGVNYRYRIKSYRKVSGKVYYSEKSNTVEQKATLAATKITSVKATDYETVKITWKRQTEAEGYAIYRATSAEGKLKRVKTISDSNTLSTTITGLTTGKKYYYVVKAYGLKGRKKVYGASSARKSATTGLAKPTDATVTPLQANKLKIEWKAVDGATSYNLYRSTSKNGDFQLYKSGLTKTSYTNSKLTNGKTYYYRISAERGNYEGKLSKTVKGTAASLEISQTSVVVQQRFSVTVTATSTPAKPVYWSTANPAIATVSDGVIKGVGVGSTVVTVKSAGITQYINVSVKETLNGIDVSKWQGTIDFKKVKEAGYNFVMMRVSHGTYLDEYFEINYKNAKAAGLAIGVYHYSEATSVEGAIAEAQQVLNVLNGRTLNYPVVVDMEDNVQLGSITNEGRTNMAKAFCNVVEAAGYQSGLYANTYWLSHYFVASELANFNLWIARWTLDINVMHDYTGPGYIFMWQYSNVGSVPGINGNVDLDISFSK